MDCHLNNEQNSNGFKEQQWFTYFQLYQILGKFQVQIWGIIGFKIYKINNPCSKHITNTLRKRYDINCCTYVRYNMSSKTHNAMDMHT